jgi:hypothetical protein
MTMHSRPTLAVSTPPAAADEAPSRVIAAPPVKPKVLRRPAQFSAPTSHAPTPETTNLRTDALTKPEQPASQALTRPWQDDGRFAISLLAIVIVVNIALSLWLSPNTHAAHRAETSGSSVALPSAHSPNPSQAASPEEALLFHLGEAGARVTEQ